MEPHATIVICTRDRPLQLTACLQSLAAQTYPRFEVLVVDNGGSPQVTAEICRLHEVRCIREAEPGLTRARNLGARAARGSVVAYVDDDAVPEPEWLGNLVRAFDDPRVAAAAGHTRYMLADPGSLEMSIDAPGTVRRAALSVDHATPGWFVLACFGGIGDGNTMAFRRSVLVDAVRFDERVGRGRMIDGGDEHLAFVSLIADGHRVVHVPDAVVRHPAPATEEGRRSKRAADARGSVAYVLFLLEHFPRYRPDIMRFVARALVKRLGGRAAAGVTGGVRASGLAAAAASGAMIYWRARREWRPSPPAPGRTAMRVVSIR
jgi:O-antigen biosynthesis protein